MTVCRSLHRLLGDGQYRLRFQGAEVSLVHEQQDVRAGDHYAFALSASAQSGGLAEPVGAAEIGEELARP